ncbi:addiction module toxin RelE [Leptospira kirschneri serovar Pomona]|uniref:Addiction module toxin RelE n=1 Tax=Leptospira kirschneri serovar Pomona TaxID=561005 RepID=A0A1T1DWN0_9LEPT|nr:addiction module toxin RelE [Leptospira kirschneri serovar Pomona]
MEEKRNRQEWGDSSFYLDIEEFSVLFLITLLEKNDKENLSKKELTILSDLITSLKEAIQSKKVRDEKRK